MRLGLGDGVRKLGDTLQPHVALRGGDTFSTGATSDRWRLGQVECTEYAPDDLFYNPFGMWRLTPVEKGDERR